MRTTLDPAEAKATVDALKSATIAMQARLDMELLAEHEVDILADLYATLLHVWDVDLLFLAKKDSVEA